MDCCPPPSSPPLLGGGPFPPLPKSWKWNPHPGNPQSEYQIKLKFEELQFDELQEKVYEFDEFTQSMGVTLGDEASHKTLPAEAAN